MTNEQIAEIRKRLKEVPSFPSEAEGVDISNAYEQDVDALLAERDELVKKVADLGDSFRHYNGEAVKAAACAMEQMKRAEEAEAYVRELEAQRPPEGYAEHVKRLEEKVAMLERILDRAI